MKKNILYIGLVYLSAFFLLGCTDPVPPEYKYREGLIFVEGFASTSPGTSFVSINESAIEFGVNVVNFVEGANVFFENTTTGETVQLTEQIGAYVPPNDFVTQVGEIWEVHIALNDGRTIASIPEKIVQPVPITSLKVDYDPELVYFVDKAKFVPGHSMTISFDDPEGVDNYYYWTYRTYENLDLCEKCIGGVFRDGECLNIGNLSTGFPYFDYPCQSDCWRIRFPQSVAIFSDKFSDGKAVTNFEIGDLLLYNKEDMVVEVQQVSLTPSAYEYYKVLKDIIDNSSGLNAPPPAALVGNLFDPNDSENFVFGRFTAAATTAAAMFVDRTSISEDPLEDRDPLMIEPTLNSLLPPPATVSAPCSETKHRTAIIPPGWIEQ